MNSHFDAVEQTINDTHELINDRHLFKEIIDNFHHSIDYINQRRLSKWLAFFNENYSKAPCIFSHSVYALFEAIEKNELFKTQTEYEFEISIKFYEKIFNANFYISIGNIKNAAHLLNIALVFGKYPGMQIRSVYKAIDLLINGVDEITLNEVFEYLFVKYENPTILSYNLNHLNLVEINLTKHFQFPNYIKEIRTGYDKVGNPNQIYFQVSFLLF